MSYQLTKADVILRDVFRRHDFEYDRFDDMRLIPQRVMFCDKASAKEIVRLPIAPGLCLWNVLCCKLDAILSGKYHPNPQFGIPQFNVTEDGATWDEEYWHEKYARGQST